MSTLLSPFVALFRWLASVFYVFRHGEEDLDSLYPDRHHASGEEAMVNGMIVGGSMLPGMHGGF